MTPRSFFVRYDVNMMPTPDAKVLPDESRRTHLSHSLDRRSK
jgi:hypothetical protein